MSLYNQRRIARMNQLAKKRRSKALFDLKIAQMQREWDKFNHIAGTIYDGLIRQSVDGAPWIRYPKPEPRQPWWRRWFA